MLKTILYEWAVALGTSMDFRKGLRRSKPWGLSRGSGWREEAVETGGWIQNAVEKNHEKDLLYLNANRNPAFLRSHPARTASLSGPLCRIIFQQTRCSPPVRCVTLWTPKFDPGASPHRSCCGRMRTHATCVGLNLVEYWTTTRRRPAYN